MPKGRFHVLVEELEDASVYGLTKLILDELNSRVEPGTTDVSSKRDTVRPLRMTYVYGREVEKHV